MVREGEAPLRRGRSRSVHKGVLSTENRDIGYDWGSGCHQGSEALTPRGGDEDVVGIDGDVFVRRGEEKGVEDFLSYLRRSGRHRREEAVETAPL